GRSIAGGANRPGKRAIHASPCYNGPLRIDRKRLRRMKIVHLSLTNFRNFSRLELDFPAGATLLYGDNAQGKTNLLEAVYYLATTRSPYAAHDNQLINWHALQAEEPLVVARMAAVVQGEAGERRIEMRLILEQQGQSS